MPVDMESVGGGIGGGCVKFAYIAIWSRLYLGIVFVVKGGERRLRALGLCVSLVSTCLTCVG